MKVTDFVIDFPLYTIVRTAGYGQIK